MTADADGSGTRIDQLRSTDEPALRCWIADYLFSQLTQWGRWAMPTWSASDINDHIAGNNLIEKEWREILEASADSARFVSVARLGVDAVGVVYAESRRDRYLCAKLGVLSWIYVAPDFRRGRIGCALLASAKRWMVSSSLTMAEVFVTASNPAAIALYSRAGFDSVDNRMLLRVS